MSFRVATAKRAISIRKLPPLLPIKYPVKTTPIITTITPISINLEEMLLRLSVLSLEFEIASNPFLKIFMSFGKKVYSPLFAKGQADLVVGLELLEGLRAADFANAKTKILVNDYFFPFAEITPKEEVLKKLKTFGKNNLYLVSATDICKEKLGKDVLAGIYLLGWAVNKNLLPIKLESVVKAIKEVENRFILLEIPLLS